MNYQRLLRLGFFSALGADGGGDFTLVLALLADFPEADVLFLPLATADFLGGAPAIARMGLSSNAPLLTL
ncbi:MAG: hypothetical protein AB7U63_05210, partial [Porticoccaceae bacterium]